MYTIRGKEFRNLEEQVLKNQADLDSLYGSQVVLNEFGIKVIGQIESVADLPTTSEEFGDAYAVGVESPFELYVWTRPNDSHVNSYWFNIGYFPMPGPQGEEGTPGINGIGISSITLDNGTNVETGTKYTMTITYTNNTQSTQSFIAPFGNFNTNQMNAVNSGITSSLVTQIGTNQTDIANKVNKTTTGLKLYGTNANGEQTTVPYGTVAAQFSIVQRKTDGQIAVPTTPSANGDATSKSYVDRISDYSTNEVAIGKWIDGSTLYRKVFNYTTANTNNEWWNVEDLVSLNIKKVVKIYGGISDGHHANVLPVAEGQYFRNLRYNEETKWLQHINNGFNDASGYIAIEYIKN